MSIGRPMQFNPEQALDRAMQVFWSQGYEFTSLQDLLAAMNLSKSSLYQTFGSKEALFDRCMTHYLDTLAAQMIERLKNAPSGRAFIEDTFRALPDMVNSAEAKKGCLLWNTANEFGQRDAAVSAAVSTGVDRFLKVFMTAIERAQREGDIPPSKEPRALATFLLANMSGLKTMLKSGLNKQRARQVVATVLDALD
jgi:TetR/AcrR family transcriptional repressor of nem operon